MEKTSDWPTFDDFLAEELKDEKFRKGYEELQVQYELILSLIRARNAGLLTQKQFEKQLAKIENPKKPLSVKSLKRIADEVGLNLRVEFVPQKEFPAKVAAG